MFRKMIGAQQARQDMAYKGVEVKGDNNVESIFRDKHDITERESYVRDINQ